MKISTNWEMSGDKLVAMSGGYTHAHHYMMNAIRDNGVEVAVNDNSAPIMLSFTSPIYHKKIGDQYTIGFSNHESSELPKSWVENLSKVDEIWAPSEFVKDVFAKYFGDKVTTVFPHGVSNEYVPKRRVHIKTNSFTFLHVGEPYQRKMGPLVAEAFQIAFKKKNDVKLIFKTNGSEQHSLPMHRIKVNSPNIRIISKYMTQQEYIMLLHKSNCLVFPSIGEGFGMINLEALATGMPIISTWEWAQYKDFIINRVDSSLGPAPDYVIKYPEEGQLLGDVYLPELDSIVENMLYVYENYKEQSEIHYENSFKVHEQYSWDNLVKRCALPRLEKIYRDVA